MRKRRDSNPRRVTPCPLSRRMHSAALPRFPGGKGNGRAVAHARSPGLAGSLTGVSGSAGGWGVGDSASILDRSRRFPQLRGVSGVVSVPLSEHPRRWRLTRTLWCAASGAGGSGAAPGRSVVHWRNTSHKAVRAGCIPATESVGNGPVVIVSSTRAVPRMRRRLRRLSRAHRRC